MYIVTVYANDRIFHYKRSQNKLFFNFPEITLVDQILFSTTTEVKVTVTFELYKNQIEWESEESNRVNCQSQTPMWSVIYSETLG